MKLPYAGPGSRSPSPSLAGWVVQPKLDGCYVTVFLDGSGHIDRLVSRPGRTLPLGDLAGVRLGDPYSILAAELTDHTEAGMSLANRLGCRHLFAFDLLSERFENLGRRPYRERRDRLGRMLGRLCDRDDDRPEGKRDRRGVVHGDDGRFRWAKGKSWRRIHLVPQSLSPQDSWDGVPDFFVEGLVLVNPESALGARNGKKKYKVSDTVSARVVSVDETRVACRRGHDLFVVGRIGKDVIPGDVVDIRHEGEHRSGRLRFPRLDRVRTEFRSHAENGSA